MKMNTTWAKIFLSFLFLWEMVSSCQFYHDTTAHYNAHFLADERMREIEEKIFNSYQDNYNEILQVLPPLDTNATAAYKADFDYCIKTASIPIQFHSQSKWTDDCYIIVGKARMYQGDFANALTTFKYVNTESDDDNARHQALILLMRIFIANNDKKSVLFTANYLAKEEKVSDENARDFYTMMAHYYRQQNNLPKTVEYIEKALPYVNNRRMKTKFYFIAAQIYQQLGNDEKAYQYYNEVLKRNPPYEMTFNAQINSSRALSMDNPDAVAKGERYLKNLLTDEKNKEYLDKVYYELGSFEARRNNAQRAIEYLKESLIANSGNSGQKIASYLKLGQVYYELKKDYPKSVNYYDSAFNLMSENSANYQKVKRQLEVLKSFAEYYTMVNEADRLLKLSAMSESEREAFIEKEIQAEREELEQERLFYLSSKKRIANKQATSNLTPSLVANNPNEKKWYFYNPIAKETGELNFFRVWGNRPLEDHWRRSQKTSISVPTNNPADNNAIVQNLNTNRPNNQESNDVERINGVEIRSKKDRLAKIPTTSDAIAKTKEDLQKGLLELGKMYYLLKENDKAQETLMRFVTEFPNNPLAPEAVFTLIRICKDTKNCDASQYEKMLKENYASSSYAKSLDNKNFFKEAKAQDSVVNRLYEEAYTLYRAEQYEQAFNALKNIERNHPESHLADKIKLLSAMLMVKTSDDLEEVEQVLGQFLSENKNSELVPLAQSLLDHIKKKRGGE